MHHFFRACMYRSKYNIYLRRDQAGGWDILFDEHCLTQLTFSRLWGILILRKMYILENLRQIENRKSKM